MSASPSILAVAVTYNRAALVTRLVRAVVAGSVVPDQILVVDNASTDSTVADLEVLAGQLEVPLRVLRLDRNTGGAGGFHAGLAAYLESAADLVWLMDDDGVPAPDCLELLLGRIVGHDLIGPLVVDEAAPEDLVFPIRLPGTARVVRRTAEAVAAGTEEVIEGIVIPFNGVLITRDLVQRIGLVREEFFIWGDDVEYLWRAERAGARIATVTPARFAHPAVGDLGTPMAFGQTYNHSPSDLKAYCMARNNWVNLRTYRGLPHALAFLAKSTWFYTLTRPDPRRLRLMWRGIAAGVRGDFTGHRRYLS